MKHPFHLDENIGALLVFLLICAVIAGCFLVVLVLKLGVMK